MNQAGMGDPGRPERPFERVRKALAICLASVLSTLLLPTAAQATLLVRSDGGGLAVTDKNNLDDEVQISGADQGSTSAYHVINGNRGDVFKFVGRVAA